MEYAQDAQPRRPQLGVRYGMSWEPARPTSRAATRHVGGTRTLPDEEIRPRSAATVLEPIASPWFYSRSAAVLWIAIGVMTAFMTTSVGMVMLLGHELRRSVAAEFVVGLVETAVSLSLGLAMWSRMSTTSRVATPALVGSIAFGAFLVVTGTMTVWGAIVAALAATCAIFSLVVLGEQLKAERTRSYLDVEDDELFDEDARSDEQGVALA